MPSKFANIRRWNQMRIAGWGATLCGTYGGAESLFESRGSVPAVDLISYALGGAMGGALIFGLWASARNWVVSSAYRRVTGLTLGAAQ